MCRIEAAMFAALQQTCSMLWGNSIAYTAQACAVDCSNVRCLFLVLISRSAPVQVFSQILIDEWEHVKTMVMCQDYDLLESLKVTQTEFTISDKDDADFQARRQLWNQWAQVCLTEACLHSQWVLLARACLAVVGWCCDVKQL